MFDVIEKRSLSEIKKRRRYLEDVLRNKVGPSEHRDWLEKEIEKEKTAQQDIENSIIL